MQLYKENKMDIDEMVKMANESVSKKIDSDIRKAKKKLKEDVLNLVSKHGVSKEFHIIRNLDEKGKTVNIEIEPDEYAVINNTDNAYIISKEMITLSVKTSATIEKRIDEISFVAKISDENTFLLVGTADFELSE
jgi:hypothetical protein